MPSSLPEAMVKPVLLAAEPQLFVADIAASCQFFVGTLGFSLAFSYGAPPFYAQIVRDGARLNLRHLDRPAFDPALRDQEGLCDSFGAGLCRIAKTYAKP